MSDKQYDTLIIGAGAAGLMAGIQAAGRGKQVLILEKMERPGRKLLITGKGRCNVTNCCTVEDFMLNVLSNKRFLYSSLNAVSYTHLDVYKRQPQKDYYIVPLEKKH